MDITRQILAANQKTWREAAQWAVRMFSKKISWECLELSDKAWARHRTKLDAWLAGDPLRGVFYELLACSLEASRPKRH
jgi:hypothetical protein